MKLMRGGLNFYFDPTGKKKRSCSLKIEKEDMPQSGMGRMPADRNRTGQDQRMRNPATMIDQVLQKATLTKNGQPFVFNRILSKNPIKIDFSDNEQNQLVFELSIPMNEIPLEDGQKIFSLGIETGEIEQGGFAGSGSGPGGPGGMGGGMSGGRSGGGGGGRMSGGRMGGPGGGMGGQSAMQGDSSAFTPIKLWFLVEL
jgi:hypothetical protein